MTNYLQAGDTVFSSDGAQKYTIVRFVGSGASSAAYLADSQPEDGNGMRCIIKEYCPAQMDLCRLPDGTLTVDADDRPRFEEGCEQFLHACRRQNTIRNEDSLTNAASPLLQTFSANGTVYAQVLRFEGDTMDRMQLTLLQKAELCVSIAKWIDTYHRNGLLCLDLKPENIFVMTDGDGSPITQSVVFIDFDSMRTKAEVSANADLSCTPAWAAPEQCNPYGNTQISEQTDAFILGELVFWSLFGRHSARRERRGYSDYDFSDTPVCYRPQVQKLFEELFRNTLRASPKNRCFDMQTILRILENIAQELRKKEYVLSSVVHMPQRLIGREEDLRRIQQKIEEAPILFLTGIGGIGKSTTIRAFASQRRKDYDILLFLIYEGSMQETFRSQVLIAAVEKAPEESAEDYYFRQMQALRRLTAGKRVLFVLDNYTRDPDALPNDIVNSGWNTIIVTRTTPPTCTYPVLELDALDEPAQLRMFSYYLGRDCTAQESKDALRIFQLVGAHTLLIELIARQIAISRLTVRQALSLVQTYGVSRMAQEKVHILKDGQIRYATIRQILSALFHNQDLSDMKRLELLLVSAFDVSGIRIEWLQALTQAASLDALNELCAQGWVQMDEEHVRLHPIISEAVRTWPLTSECREAVLRTIEKVYYLLKTESEKNEYPADLLNHNNQIRSAMETFPFLRRSIERNAERYGFPGKLYLHRLSQSNFGERPDPEKMRLYLDTAQRLLIGCRADSIVREADIYKELSFLAILNANGEQESFAAEQSSLLLDQPNMNPVAEIRILDRLVGFCCERQDSDTAQEYAQKAKRLSETGHSAYLKAVYYDLLATICDAKLQGAYDPQTEEEAQLVSELLRLLRAAMRYADRTRQGSSGNMRIQYTLSYLNVLMRHRPQDKKEIDRYMRTLTTLLDKYALPNSLNRYWYSMCRGWYYTLVEPDPEKLILQLHEAAQTGEALFSTAIEQINNTLIPAANMMMELGMVDGAFTVLCRAAEVCTDKSNIAVYCRKKAELLTYLRAIQREVDDTTRGQEIEEKIRSLEQTEQ